MKQHAKYLSLILLATSLIITADHQTVTPKFTIRSQGTNALRRLVGTVDKVDIYDMDENYHNLSAMLEYTRSFNAPQIAECLFGSFLCDKRILKIQGSQACNRDECALLADYFYLPTDFSSEVIIEPLIQNVLIDFNYYVGFDHLVHGLYFWVQAPLTWTKWDLRYHERVIDPGINAYNEGYFTVNALPRNQLLNSFAEFVSGNAPGTDNVVTQFAAKGADAINAQFDTTFQSLQCARICPDSKTNTSLSELRFALGWNFLLKEDYHLGLNIQASAPTGNKVKSKFLFSPQNGNDKHWELGGGLGAHYIFWRSQDEEKHFGFYLDANITHMFNNNECRCFDLCNKPLSRYMLAEKLTTDVADNLEGNGTAATAQFNEVFAPVANLTTFDVNVSVAVNADVVAMFNYTSGSWSWDFGYNFWGRSCEKIKLDCKCPTFLENTWALKGDAQVYGYMSASDTDLLINDPVALSATQSEATINAGKNFPASGTITTAQINAGRLNPNIDNPQLATADTSDTALNASRSSGGLGQIHTSIQPVFIAQSDVNFVRTKGISNKIFYHMGYTWTEKNHALPYVGIGGEVEWASTSGSSCCKDDCETDCCGIVVCCDADTKCDEKCDDSCDASGSCVKCGLSQWGIWFKAGANF
ncbi:MAG TPA: hypothetical protein PLU71_01630 [Candidatus Dependentiae bacterium]|nr:hypothetical protein [Candidatus Dependentiae bacterium]HRQ62532.1 hypothetical protein [Candidatus Dependentiae bacterium]